MTLAGVAIPRHHPAHCRNPFAAPELRRPAQGPSPVDVLSKSDSGLHYVREQRGA